MATDDKIPTSRIARSSRVGRLAASQAARQAGTRAANAFRGEDARKEAVWRAAGWCVLRVPSEVVYEAPERLLALAPET